MSKSQTQLLFILALLVTNSWQFVRDESFINFCNKVGSTPVTVENPKSVEADTCEVLWKQFPASDDEEAKMYCKNWGPYSLLASKAKGGLTWCKYENVYSCDTGYTQINGLCYKRMTKTVVGNKEAKTICEAESRVNRRGKVVKSELIKLYDPDLIRLIMAFFHEITQFLVQNSDVLDEYVEFDGGDSKSNEHSRYIVAIGTASHYDVGPGDLIRLPETSFSKMPCQLFCQYQPDETPLSFGVKARMIVPYYYPSVRSGAMTAWRTANHYSFMRHGRGVDPVDLCSKSLSAITGPDGGDIWDATINNVKLLTDEFKKEFVKSYAPFYHCCHSYYYYDNHYQRTYGEDEILVYSPRDYYSLTCPSKPVVNQDYSMISHPVGCMGQSQRNTVRSESSFIFTPEKIGDYDITERNQRVNDAPLLCSIYYRLSDKPTKCLAGWIPHTRKNGQNVCFGGYIQQFMSYPDAANWCRTMGAELATFSDEEEINIIHSFSGPNEYAIWIGMRVRKGCRGRNERGNCDSLTYGIWDNKYGDSSKEVMELVNSRWEATDDEVKPEHDCIQYYPKRKTLYDYFCTGKGDPAYPMCISGYQLSD